MHSWLKAILIAAIVVGIATIAVVAVFSMRRQNRSDECRFHLMRMWNALGAAESDRHPEWDHVPTGRAFWNRSQDWPGSRIEIDRRDLICPESARTEPGLGVENVAYRGPGRSYRKLKPEDPVAADRPGNHLERGNVLLKSGAIHDADETMWRRAGESTCE